MTRASEPQDSAAEGASAREIRPDLAASDAREEAGRDASGSRRRDEPDPAAPTVSDNAGHAPGRGGVAGQETGQEAGEVSEPG
jgi:hypothetical protein